jgi:hypothetical protein
MSIFPKGLGEKPQALHGLLIALAVTVLLTLAGCGPVEIDHTTKRVMPAFLVNLIAKGFWGTVLAGIIFNIPVGILQFILTKINKILGIIVFFCPMIFFWFYVWHIRRQGWWLFSAIAMVLWFIISLVLAAIKKPVKADTNTPAQSDS